MPYGSCLKAFLIKVGQQESLSNIKRNSSVTNAGKKGTLNRRYLRSILRNIQFKLDYNLEQDPVVKEKKTHYTKKESLSFDERLLCDKHRLKAHMVSFCYFSIAAQVRIFLLTLPTKRAKTWKSYISQTH